MPTNVTTEYALAEKKYHEATTIEDKISALREMYATAPKHKGTENLLRDIKARLAKLRKLQEKNRSKKKGKSGLNIKKHGAAQVIITGYVNTGKSALFNSLIKTNKSKIAEFPFTTINPVVGVMKYQDVDIQLIDMPPIFEGISNNSRGPMLLSLLRQSDLNIFLITELNQLIIIEKELNNLGMKIKVSEFDLTKFNLKQDLISFGIINKNEFNILKKQNNLSNIENLFELKSLILLNKMNNFNENHLKYNKLNNDKQNYKVNNNKVNDNEPNDLYIIKELIWNSLNIIRIYTKEQGKKPDLTNPITAKQGSKLKDIIPRIHKTLLQRFKYAKIYGDSVSFDGAIVGLNHELKDKDIIEIHSK